METPLDISEYGHSLETIEIVCKLIGPPNEDSGVGCLTKNDVIKCDKLIEEFKLDKN